MKGGRVTVVGEGWQSESGRLKGGRVRALVV